MQVGIYIHIPFCIRKCNYCDFLSGPSNKEERETYTKVLIDEMKRRSIAYKSDTVSTVFIGGGTPTCLEVDCLEEIIDTVQNCFSLEENAEISMELNPGTVTRESLIRYKQMGINRLSIGLQSTIDEELRLLGRIHTYEDFKVCYKQIREVGFSNVNIDLMSGLPNQTLEGFRQTLERVVLLNPEHISAYSLIIEEGTPFYQKYQDFYSEEQEKIDRNIYHFTKSYLKEHGYERYEISNYAKHGYESRHNSSYWTGIPYLGFGLGASSYEIVNNQYIRSSNARNFEDYQDGKLEEYEVLSLENRMEEFMFLGLRMMRGVAINAFYNHFGKDIESIYRKVINELSNQNLIEKSGNYYRLTEYGIDVSNYVLAQFLLV